MTFPIEIKDHKDFERLLSQIIKYPCKKCHRRTIHLIMGYNGRSRCLRCHK